MIVAGPPHFPGLLRSQGTRDSAADELKRDAIPWSSLPERAAVKAERKPVTCRGGAWWIPFECPKLSNALKHLWCIGRACLGRSRTGGRDPSTKVAPRPCSVDVLAERRSTTALPTPKPDPLPGAKRSEKMAAFSSVLQRLRRDGAGARRTKECASCSSTRSSTFSHIARAARSRRSVEDVVELVTSAKEEEGVETSSHRRRLLAGMGGLVGSMVVSGIDGASAESESTGYDPNESREANRRENSMAALQGKDYGKTKMRFSDYTLTESGLQYKDLREGEGPSPKKGDRVVIDWDGYTIGYCKAPRSLAQRGRPLDPNKVN